MRLWLLLLLGQMRVHKGEDGETGEKGRLSSSPSFSRVVTQQAQRHQPPEEVTEVSVSDCTTENLSPRKGTKGPNTFVLF